MHELIHKSEEMRLREHICQLKTIRATIQGTVVDLEPFSHQQKVDHNQKSLNHQEQIEAAVFRQELMAAKEEIADLKAKIYVSDKEKAGKLNRFSLKKMTPSASLPQMCV